MLHTWRSAWGLRDLVKIPANKPVSLKHLLHLEILLNNCEASLTVQREQILWLLLRVLESKSHHPSHLKHLVLFLMGITS